MWTNEQITIGFLVVALVVLAWYHAAVMAKIMSFLDNKKEGYLEKALSDPVRAAHNTRQHLEQYGVDLNVGRDNSLTGLTHEQMAEAERAAWMQAQGADGIASYNVEQACDTGADVMQAHTAAPDHDYMSHITDLVVDDRTRKNHQEWAEGQKQATGRMRNVESEEERNEIVSMSLHRQGLRMPQSVFQSRDALFVTEADGSHLANHKHLRWTS